MLVVHVSSLCGLTPTNYPELTALDEKCRAQGLEILAFPCNQFASQEPGSHEEIMEFVKQYNFQFPFFEKEDVNGKSVYLTYLKNQLPGKILPPGHSFEPIYNQDEIYFFNNFFSFSY